jgi:hypothetical protein
MLTRRRGTWSRMDKTPAACLPEGYRKTELGQLTLCRVGYNINSQEE